MDASKCRASVPCSVRTKFIRRKLIRTAAVPTDRTHATWIARRRVWQTHSCSLNALVSYFVVASRSVKIGVCADQKDFLGDCYAENRRYMASEGNKIHRKIELLNRHISYWCSMAFFLATEVSSKFLNGRYMYTHTPSYEDRCSTVTALRYITRKSCIKNTSIVPFPNLASMLLSVQAAKSNRGISSIAWINDDKKSSFSKVVAASFINQLFRTGRSRTLHFQI